MYDGSLSSKGFSLVELMVSVFIIMIGILGITKLVLNEYYSVNKARTLSNEIVLLQNISEKIMSTNFEDLGVRCQKMKGVRNRYGKRFYVNCKLIRHSTKLKQILVSISSKGSVYTVSLFRSLGD